MNEREQFEAWYRDKGWSLLKSEHPQDAAEAGWQARAALSAPPTGLGETDIYDFAGWLTTRPGVMPVGASSDAAPMAEAVGEYIKAFPQRFVPQPPSTCIPVPRQVLLDTIAQLWEPALGEEDCPLCGGEGDELHDNGCLLGQLQMLAAAPHPESKPQANVSALLREARDIIDCYREELDVSHRRPDGTVPDADVRTDLALMQDLLARMDAALEPKEGEQT